MSRVIGLSSRAIVGRFYQTFEGELAKGYLNQIAMTIPSDQESESYKWLGATPKMREWIGERIAAGLNVNGMTIVNRTWESTLRINVDDLRRDKTGQINVRIDEMAARAAEHPLSLLSTLVTNGDGATSGLCYDGQYFFDTDHAEGDSGAQKNLLTASEVTALNVTTATQPTQAEMASAILGVIGYMYGFKDDRGEPLNGGARSFVVMTPVGLWGPALAAATQTTVIGATGAVAPNPLAAAGITIKVVCNPRLAWTDAFAIFRVDGFAKPFIYQEELPPQMSVLAEGSELEINGNEHQYGIKSIYNVGYGLWQHAAKATLS